MRPRPPVPEGPYLIVGLARSGAAAARVLRERGERVVGVDAGRPLGSGAPSADDCCAGAWRCAWARTASGELEHARAVVKSPGVPAQAPAIAAARERGVPVLGELEFAWRLLRNEFIAVTGTNGKTTTVEWIGHIHREAGLPVAVAGNVGAALSGLVGQLDERATIVCETSSFQLEDALAFAPEAAVLLNITPDHLDRHGTLEAYREAKLRIFAHQRAGDVAVLPAGLAEIPLAPGVRRVRFGEGEGAGEGESEGAGEARRGQAGEGADAECAFCDGRLWWEGEPLVATEELSLRGEHNAGTRWPPPRCASRAGSTATRCARGCAASRASPTAWRRSRAGTACSTSTTPRRPTSRARSSHCERSRRAAST